MVHSSQDTKIRQPRQYRQVFALMLCWVDKVSDGTSVFDLECHQLGEVLSDAYNFQVLHRRIPLSDPQKAIEDVFKKIKRNLSRHDLLIVHYSGHGSISTGGDFLISPSESVRLYPTQDIMLTFAGLTCSGRRTL